MRKFKWRLAPLVAAALAAAGAVGAAPAAAAPLPDVTFAATADAYVAEATPAVAKGSTDSQNCFVNDDSPSRQRCEMSFTVSGLGAGDTVTAAKLLVMDKGNATGSKLVNVYQTSGAWTETAVTWNNQPTLGTVVGSQTSHLYNADSVFNLAAGTVAGNGTYAFALGSPPASYPTGMNFYPKENTAGKPGPRLVLSIDHQSPPVAVLTQPDPVNEDTVTTLTAIDSTDPDDDIAGYDWNFGDGSPVVTNAAWWFIDHTYANPGSYTVTVTVRDSGGRTSTDSKTIVVNAVVPPIRFPGDPGVGNVYTGLNSGSQYNTVQTAMPHPFMVRRVYNGTNFGVPNIAVDKTAGRIPMVSWKYGSYSPGNVPASAFQQVCTDLAAYGGPVIASPLFHEPTGDITGATTRAAYRADQRTQVLTCRAAGVTNVAWTSPYFEGPFGFTTGSGISWTQLYADCASGCDTSSPTFYTGSNRVYDLDGIDVYQSPSIDTRTYAAQMRVIEGAFAAKGLTPLPWAVGELGINSAPDASLRAGKMTAAVSDINSHVNDYAAVAWWSTGGEEFCATNTTTDPGCASQTVLYNYVNQSSVTHP